MTEVANFADPEAVVTRRPDLLTLDQGAAYLGISTRSLRRLIADGRIRVIRPSPGRVYVTRRELDAYLASLERRRA